MNTQMGLKDPNSMKTDACCFEITSDVDWEPTEKTSASVNATRQLFVDNSWPVMSDNTTAEGKNIFRCSTP